MSILNNFKKQQYEKKLAKARLKKKGELDRVFDTFQKRDFERYYTDNQVSVMYYSENEDAVYMLTALIQDNVIEDDKQVLTVYKRVKGGYETEEYNVSYPAVKGKVEKLKEMLARENQVAEKQNEIWGEANVICKILKHEDSYPNKIFERFGKGYSFEMNILRDEKKSRCGAYYFEEKSKLIYYCDMALGKNDLSPTKVYIIKKDCRESFEKYFVKDIDGRVEKAMRQLCALEHEASAERKELWQDQPEDEKE